jgi:tRNA-specific 2-thiouridylase
VPGHLGFEDGQPAVFFETPEEGVARGQAAVLYDPDGETRILGGGFISRSLPADERVAMA